MKEQKCLTQHATKNAFGLAAFSLSGAELNKVKGGTDFIIDEEGNFIIEDVVVGI